MTTSATAKTSGPAGRPSRSDIHLVRKYPPHPPDVAKPMPGWSGIVECKVLEVRAPFLLRYTWLGGEQDDLTTVTNRLEQHERGTLFTWDHTGFTGVGGYIVSRVLNRVRGRMLDRGFPAVFNDLDDEGKLRPGSTLKPKP